MPSRPLFNGPGVPAASIAGAAEAVICTLSTVSTKFPNQGVKLTGFAVITAEAAATEVILTVRRASLNGAIVGDPITYDGADITGAKSTPLGIDVVDAPSSLSNGVYVLTATVTTAGGASTVETATLTARVD